ncbi:CRAL/TRIO domain-containing protein, partial [Clavulina sp. PMI_390]
THEILTLPSPLVKAVPKEYTEQQQKQIQELREYGQSIMLPETDPYYPNEKKWLIEDEACAERYMRASKWRMDEAKKRIKGTLEWRRDYKPDLIPADEVKVEAETGKIILTGFDRDGRPILYLRPGRENTKESPRQIRHLVFLIERAIDFMPPHVESMMCLVDYRSATLKTSPSISNARHFLGIVQNHYVERLGRAIVVNLPFILNFFFKAITPFMDPVTRDKRFNPNLLDLIPPEQLDATLQKGTYDFEFEHELYWKTI